MGSISSMWLPLNILALNMSRRRRKISSWVITGQQQVTPPIICVGPRCKKWAGINKKKGRTTVDCKKTTVLLADPKNKIQQSDKVIVKQSILSQKRLGVNESPTVFFRTLKFDWAIVGRTKTIRRLLRSPRNRFRQPMYYVALRAGATTLFLLGS